MPVRRILDWLPRPTPRTLAGLLILGASYYLGGRLGLLLAIGNSSISVVWPPTGIALAALLLEGVELWPAITVTAFLVNFGLTGDPVSSGLIAVGNTLEPVVGALLVRRFARGANAIERPEDVLRFALFAAVAATLLSASIRCGALWLRGHLATGAWIGAWGTWWAGDAIGALDVAPFLLVVAEVWRRPSGSRGLPGTWPEAAAVAAAAAVAVLFVFGRPPSAFLGGVASVFVVLPPVVWAAFRFGPLGAALSVVPISVAGVLATVHGLGPFTGLPPGPGLDTARVFVASLALTGLLVGTEALQRQRAETALERTREDLERTVRDRTATLATALRLARLGSYEMDLRTGQVSWSEEMYRIYGYEETGFPLDLSRALERVHPDDRPQILATLTEDLQAPGSEPRPFRGTSYRIRLPSGETRYLQGSGQYLEKDHGRPVRLIGAVQDVTEEVRTVAALRQRESALERSNRELEQFAYAASHDLQEPLGMIEGYTRLLADRFAKELPPEAAEFVGVTRDAATRLRALIDGLLAYSRVEEAGVGPRSDVPLESVLDEALANLRAPVELTGARIVRVGPLPHVLGDPAQLVRLFQNTLSNAIKFRAAAAPVIRISAGSDGPWVRVAIADNGIGIPPEDQSRLFTLFHRLHTREEYPGHGIGLAIAKKVVEAHGGRISVESSGRPGEGTTDLFTLPSPSTADPGPPRSEAAPERAGPARSPSAAT
jgi:PAS domain S-box-containing protein